jgi:hypothetical protein
MKKISLIIFLFLISTTSALAVSNTITATSSANNINSSEIQSLIKQLTKAKLNDDEVEVKRITDLIKEKTKSISNSANITTVDTKTSENKSSPKSFFGTITKINGTQITIDYKNNQKTLNTDDTTTFIDTKKVKTQLSKIKVGQDILALGYLSSESTLDTKRLIVTDLKAIENNNQVVIGKIVDISKSSPIFVLIPTKDKNSQFQIKTDDKTLVLNKTNNKSEIKNLVSGDKVIVIMSPDPKIAKTFSALKVITQDK